MDPTTGSLLSSYIADDAPWSFYPLDVLREQCIRRTLSPEGDADRLRFRLEDYHLRHKREERAHFPWHTSKDMIYFQSEIGAQGYSPLLLKVRDRSCFWQGTIEKHFTLVLNSRTSRYYDWSNVTIGRNPTCNCAFKNLKTEDGYTHYTCAHILYVLKYILGCPEPLRFQGAFLVHELVKIFHHSTVFDLMERYIFTHPNPNAEKPRLRLNFNPSHPDRPTQICTMCFRFINFGDRTKHCLSCGLPIHRSCHKHMIEHRKEAGGKLCSLHHDFNEWSYALYVSGRGFGWSENHFRAERAEALETGLKKESEEVDMEDVFDDDFWLEGNDLDLEMEDDSELGDDGNINHQAVGGLDQQDETPDATATATDSVPANDISILGNDQREITLTIRPRRSVKDQEKFDGLRP